MRKRKISRRLGFGYLNEGTSYEKIANVHCPRLCRGGIFNSAEAQRFSLKKTGCKLTKNALLKSLSSAKGSSSVSGFGGARFDKKSAASYFACSQALIGKQRSRYL